MSLISYYRWLVQESPSRELSKASGNLLSPDTNSITKQLLKARVVSSAVHRTGYEIQAQKNTRSPHFFTIAFSATFIRFIPLP